MRLNVVLIVGAICYLPSLGFAQSGSGTNISSDSAFVLNTLLLLLGGILVFFMHIGFAMLECGLVQSKNVNSQLTKNFGLILVSLAAFFFVGYNLMYPLGNWTFEGYISGSFAPAALEPVAPSIDKLDDYFYATTGSDFFFQVMFCAAAATIVSGTIAERMKIGPFLIFVAALAAFIYPILGSWKWGGGFLDEAGFLDFAGATLVHSVGGWAALVGAIFVGPRLNRFSDDHQGSNKIQVYSLPLASLGAMLLWLGWLGFNGGSQLAFGSIADAADVSRIFGNTTMAAVGGGIAAMIITSVRSGKLDVVMVLNGSLGGLVAITAEPLFPSLLFSIFIGFIGGSIVVFGTDFLRILRIDDVVSAIPVHLFAGILGTLIVPLTNDDANFASQLFGVFVYGMATVLLSAFVWLLLNFTIGLRVDPRKEQEGLDRNLLT